MGKIFGFSEFGARCATMLFRKSRQFVCRIAALKIRRTVAGLQNGSRAAVLIDLALNVARFVAVARVIAVRTVVARRRIAVNVDIDAVVPNGDIALRRAHAAFMPATASVVAHAVARHAVADGAAFLIVAVIVALHAAAEGEQGSESEGFHGCFSA